MLYLKRQNNVLWSFYSLKFENNLFRSSRLEVFCRKCVLRNFAKFTGNTCARASKFLRTPFFNRTPPVGASIYLAIIFSVVCFIAVYTAGKLQVKYFALIDFAAAAITYFFLRLWSLTKDFFTIERTAGS